MSETTNHVVEANNSLDQAVVTNSGDTCEPWIMQAQVHATLALVEQQRIASIIAYVAASPGMAGGHKAWIEKELGL